MVEEAVRFVLHRAEFDTDGDHSSTVFITVWVS